MNNMNVQTLLLRLQNELKQEGLSQQMLLYSGEHSISSSEWITQPEVNFVIGYNGSPNSQTALDFVFWMAHQARLLTQRQVTVHVVYALDSCGMRQLSCTAAATLKDWQAQLVSQSEPSLLGGATLKRESRKSTWARDLVQPAAGQLAQLHKEPAHVADQTSSLRHALDHADRILWQARCLADEWRGSLEAHLRFGDMATELRQIVDAKAADLLFVGCSFAEHPLVQRLTASGFPCPILGIPTELEAQ